MKQTTNSTRRSPKAKSTSKARVPKVLSSRLLSSKPILFALAFAVVGALFVFKSFAASALWLPTADKPLRLGWVLDTITSADNLQTVDLKGQPIPEADVYDIDGETTPKSVVDALHNKGKKVICYIDAGVWEPVRSDAGTFPGSQNYGKTYTGDPQYANVNVIGALDQGWGKDRWLDIRRIDILKPIMMNRMQNWCLNKGFDSIEPDEITNYSNTSGFPLTYADQIAYNTAVASWAHELGLSIGLKGDIEQAADLSSVFDWSLNEECFMYNECTQYNLQSFTQKNKAVWVAEYPSEYPSSKKDSTTSSLLTSTTYNNICTTSAANKFNTAFYILGLPLNGGRTDCPPYAATTPTTPPPAPTVTLTSSATYVTAPANFTVTANASELSNFELTMNNNVVQNCLSATTCAYNATNLQAGTYAFKVTIATVASGASASASLSMNVAQGSTPPPANMPPTVSLSAGALSATAPATLTLTANATDADGSVAKVQLFLGGVQVSVDALKSPYTFTLPNTDAGTYTFTAVATDNLGAVSSASNPVTIVVNAPPPPPVSTAPVWPADATMQAAFSSLKAQLNCNSSKTCKIDVWWPNATDDVAVTGYQVWRAVDNNTAVRVTTNAPDDLYFTDFIAKTKTYTYSVKAVDASGNKTPGPSKTIKVSCTLGICSL